MGWQRLVLDRALEVARGRDVFREVNLSTPRQCGKSTLLLALIVDRMVRHPGSWITYTSNARLAGRRKLLRSWWPIVHASKWGEEFKVSRGAGQESIEHENGSVLYVLSGDEASGHGDTLHLAVLDEAWSLTLDAEQGVRPAMSTTGGQLWVVSTAGNAKSTYWRDKVEAGRAGADGTCFIEWAARADVDVSDRGTWPSFMPALGRTTDEATVAGDLASMRLSEWERAYANRWSDECGDGWQVIDEELWAASRWAS